MAVPTRARFVVTIAAALLFGGTLIAQTAPAKTGARGGTVRAAIDAANKKFLEGARKKDASIIASVYTEEAEAFPPNGEVVKGRAALQKMWQGTLDSGLVLDLVTREVESSGDLAYESGTYSIKTADGTVADRGKYSVVWKRVGGQWLLHRDIWNTSLPEAKK